MLFVNGLYASLVIILYIIYHPIENEFNTKNLCLSKKLGHDNKLAVVKIGPHSTNKKESHLTQQTDNKLSQRKIFRKKGQP